MSNRRSYEELISISTFEDRLNYLKLHGSVGKDIFGFDRYLNQKFYTSPEWKHIRREIVLRDFARDLGVPDYDIVESKNLIIHHINPITLDDLKYGNDSLLDPSNLITTSRWTHQIIHYGNNDSIEINLGRSPFDTCPWRKVE